MKVRMYIENTTNSIYSCMIGAEKMNKHKIIKSFSIYAEFYLILKQSPILDV